MQQVVNRILVLGGGSAGFMAALALKTRVPAASVRILRSPELGIIGVGEGSTAALTDFLHQYLRVPSKTFHELAAPTWKLGLKFLHWGSREYFNYSFGPGLEIRSVPDQRKPNGFYCDENIEYPDPYSALMTHDRVFPRTNGRMSPDEWPDVPAPILRLSLREREVCAISRARRARRWRGDYRCHGRNGCTSRTRY